MISEISQEAFRHELDQIIKEARDNYSHDDKKRWNQMAPGARAAAVVGTGASLSSLLLDVDRYAGNRAGKAPKRIHKAIVPLQLAGIGATLGSIAHTHQRVKKREGPKAAREYLWGSKKKQAEIRAIGSKDDTDDPAQHHEIFKDQGEAACRECGAKLHEEDTYCKRCGARQAVPKRPPPGRRFKRAEPKPIDEEEHGEQGETGGSHSERDAKLEMGKAASLLKTYSNQLSAAKGVAVLGGSGYAAYKLNQLLNPKKPENANSQGMVRTASVRRGINPVFRIRKGRKLKKLRELLGR